MSNNLNLPTKLLDYLNETRAGLPPLNDPDQPLQIDSLGLIRLVAFFESDLHIEIEDEELLADNFATPRALSDLLERKRAAGQRPAGAEEASGAAPRPQ